MFKPHTKADLEFTSIRDIGGEGKNATTHLCHDAQMDAEIVVKRIEKAQLDTAQYFEEARLLYRGRHPNVVPLHYACQDDDAIYIAMPHYERGSLKTLMNGRFLTVREIVTISCQILTALHHIHVNKLVHFDIKPDNVLISRRGDALLADFGLARAVAASGRAVPFKLYGKIKPPEAIRGGYEFNNTFDIYQFGLLLYRMCNGDEEFYRQFASYGAGQAFDRDRFIFDVRNGRFPERSKFPEHIPARLKRACQRCLEVDPNDRFQTAVEISNELAQLDGGFMDWVFAPDNGCKIWRKNVEGTNYEFWVHPDERTEMFKTVGAGQRRRIGRYSLNRITSREIRSALGDA
jgi:serine/threonine protein kinase